MQIYIEANSEFSKIRLDKLYSAVKLLQYNDVMFSFRDRSIFAHMNILSACSQVFVNENVETINAMFGAYDDIVVDAILKFCYTGIIDIEKELYDKFKDLATQLEITTLFYEKITEKNCLEVLTLSNDFKSRETAMDLTLTLFEKLYKTKDFVQLPYSTLVEIIKSNFLSVSSEMHVLKSVKLWVEEDHKQRKPKLPELLSYIKLPALTMEINLTDTLSNFYSSTEYIKMITETIESILLKKRTNTDRRWKIEKIALVGSSVHALRNKFELFDLKENKWSLSKSYSFFKTNYASTLVDDCLLIIGGFKSSKVECINLRDGTKHQLESLNENRWMCSVSTVSNKSSSDVYVLGGFNNNKKNSILSSVERWNNKTQKWDMNVSPLKLAVCGHTSSVIGDTIYVIGGQIRNVKTDRATNKVQIYSTKTDSWNFCTSMNQKREGHSCAIFKGNIYVAGGRISETESIDSVEYYNPKAKNWTDVVKLPHLVYGFSLCSFRNKLICIGGMVKNEVTNSVFEYDDLNRNWKAIESLSAKRYGLPLVAHVIPYNSLI